MTSAELAAYVGAAAWLPQIITWLYNRYSKPELTLVLGRHAELGFTSYGPIFNVNVAMTSDRKPLIVKNLTMKVVHEDGQSREFRWSGIQEDLGQSLDAAGLTQGRLQKDTVPIAVKIATETLVERFVRFQEPKFRDGDRPLLKSLVLLSEHLRRTDNANRTTGLLASRELFEVLDFREKAFWWKPGNYTVALIPSSSVGFKRASPHQWSFKLEPWQVDELKQNIALNKTELDNAIRSNDPGFEAVPLHWKWAYPDLTEEEAAATPS